MQMFSKTGVKRVVHSQYLLHVLRKEPGTGADIAVSPSVPRTEGCGVLITQDLYFREKNKFSILIKKIMTLGFFLCNNTKGTIII